MKVKKFNNLKKQKEIMKTQTKNPGNRKDLSLLNERQKKI